MNLDALTEVLSLLWDSRYHPGWQYKRSHGEGVAFEMQEDDLQAVYGFKDESVEGSKSTAGLHMSAPQLRGCEPEEIVALLREEITDPGIPGMGRSRTSRALLFGKTACWLAETGAIPAEDRARFLALMEGERELSPEMQRQLDHLRKQQ